MRSISTYVSVVKCMRGDSVFCPLCGENSTIQKLDA